MTAAAYPESRTRDFGAQKSGCGSRQGGGERVQYAGRVMLRGTTTVE
ncbi:hypothetical protein GA0115254_10609 [Streptomyces sp. Ncost-T10-10d]|nr:hypothetical protein GA0115254_10609 [Streptomyces sp. Ncost-T10-10d]